MKQNAKVMFDQQKGSLMITTAEIHEALIAALSGPHGVRSYGELQPAKELSARDEEIAKLKELVK